MDLSLNKLLFVILACKFGGSHSAILSRNKAVKAINDYYDWAPARMVDGDLRTDAGTCFCCSITPNELNPWYELDLGKSHRINKIDVIGRIEGKTINQHFQNMQIMFRQASEGFTDSPETAITEITANVTYVLPVPKYTRYILLVLRHVTRHFTICELTVYGDCNNGEFGDYCEKRCHCDGDQCVKLTGICPSGKCLPGYSGEKCDAECQNRTYSSGCTQQCGNCLNNVECDKAIGICPGRCSAGYQGALCKQECNANYYGQYCLSQCGSCLNGDTCNHVTGICTNGCADGYLDGHGICDLLCDPGYYGKNCQTGCGYCRQGTVCIKTNGTCPSGCSSGYHGDLCKTACDDGFYGDGCQFNCGNCANGTTCNKVSGLCGLGCSPGYNGSYCNQSCVDGSYGDNCQGECGNCKDDTVCNKINGVCDTGCEAGYKRDLCLEDCADGKYGESCSNECGQCFNGTACDKVNGRCSSCAEGFMGTQCRPSCSDGFYGDNCERLCGNCKGYKINEICEAGCGTGYKRQLCIEEESPPGKESYSVPVGLAIGGTAGTILVIEAFVGAIVYLIWKRRQGQADRRSPEEVNPYEMPDRETFTSEHPYELKQRSITTTPTNENTQRSQTTE